MAFFSSLLSSDDRSADSVIVGGLIALVVLCGLSLWDVIRSSHEFSALNFGGGCAAVLGGIGGAKRLRDGADGKSDAA